MSVVECGVMFSQEGFLYEIHDRMCGKYYHDGFPWFRHCVGAPTSVPAVILLMLNTNHTKNKTL